MKKIGNVITKARKKAGLTQETLAFKLGLTPQAISKWENDIGYPDVSLLADISEILDISLDDLFGVEDDGFAKSFCDLPLVYSYDNIGLYSDKTVADTDSEGKTVRFCDGSFAKMQSQSAYNVGAGEIRFKKLQKTRRRSEKQKRLETALESFDSIDMDLSISGDIEIVSASDGKAKLLAEGEAAFVDALEIKPSGTCLCVLARFEQNSRNGGNRENKLKLTVPFSRGKLLKIKVSGSSDCKIEPSFDEAVLKVSGSGNIKTAECGILEASVAGSADMIIEKISKCGVVKIAGSADIAVGFGHDLKISVSGSGDLHVASASGTFEVVVNGAADVRVGGKLEKLALEANGSADFNGKELVVKDADISVSGAADVIIQRICGASSERLGENCNYTVLNRGGTCD